jgi:hypothetical protein
MKNLIKTQIIVEKYFRKTESAMACLYIAIELVPYYENLKRLDENYPELVRETIEHDYMGLRTDNEYFVPRLG